METDIVILYKDQFGVNLEARCEVRLRLSKESQSPYIEQEKRMFKVKPIKPAKRNKILDKLLKTFYSIPSIKEQLPPLAGY